MTGGGDRVVVLDLEGDGPELRIVEGEGRARAVVWPGMGARDRSIHHVALGAGGRTIALSHPSEAVYYVVAGSGHVRRGDKPVHALVAGSLVHVAAGAVYTLAAGPNGMELVGGPCPADERLYRDSPPPAAEDDRAAAIQTFHRDRPQRMLPQIAQDARLIVWPGVGAQTATMNYVDMQPGEANVPHAHATSEDTITVLAGRGSVDDLGNGVTLTFESRQVVHIPRGLRHCVKADRDSRIQSVGGPSPADMAMLGEDATGSGGP